MAKKKKIYKVGIDSETYAISLVQSPAIEETLVALEEQKEIKVQLADETKHMVYSAVLVPDKPIYRRNEDGEEFYVEFTKESIEKMSQDFLKNYRQNEVTLDHQDMASDITVVESWIKTDLFKDKSVALGLNEQLPIGTWFCGMKVNQIDAWERVLNGELRGFSVESLIRLEEFEKQNDNNMEIETNEMFWTKFKNVLSEVFASLSMIKKEGEDIEPVSMEDLEEQTPAQETTEEPTVEVVEVTPPPTTEEEKAVVEEQTNSAATETVTEQPQENNKHLEELINSLKEEINALKEMNNGLNDKVKELSKEPSTKPISVQGGGGKGDTYSQWREQMRNML